MHQDPFACESGSFECPEYRVMSPHSTLGLTYLILDEDEESSTQQPAYKAAPSSDEPDTWFPYDKKSVSNVYNLILSLN